MAGGILTVLSVILWILLAVLILLILLLLILLFAPISYRLKGSYIDELPDGTADVRAFFGMIHLSISYDHGVAESGYIKMLGITIYRIEGAQDEEGD